MSIQTNSTDSNWRDHDDRDAHQARLTAELTAEMSAGPDTTW
jgi:hypothetical protein